MRLFRSISAKLKGGSIKHALAGTAIAVILAGCSSVQPNNSALLLQDKSANVANASETLTRSLVGQTSTYAQEAKLADDEDDATDLDVKDPHEGLNRTFHGINRGFDLVLVRPLSKVYGTVIPGPIRLMVRNTLRNLEGPGDIINYTIQGNGDEAGKTAKRFVINSTLGLGGLFDVADHLGTPYNPTDFGLTLAARGVGEGNYIVTPLLGPSTTRDSVGRVVDIALSPTTYVGLITDFNFAGLIARGTATIDRRERNGALLDNVIFASPDPYVTLRSTYIQRRRALASGDASGGDGTEDALPEIETSGS